ncbi:MAG: hypothetical protein V2B17_07755 [Chloroflexota bacterium]
MTARSSPGARQIDPAPHDRSTPRSLLLGATIVALVGMLHAPGLMAGPTLDGAIFTTVARAMRDGGTLYVDVWDHKPPGIFWLLQAGQAIAPQIDPWLVTWVTSVIAGIATALLALRCCNVSRERLIAGLLVAVYGSIYPLTLGGGQTEAFAALFIAAAYVASARGSVGAALTSGVALGIACVFSMQAVAPGACLLAVVAYQHGWRHAARVTLGGGIIGMVTLVALTLNGSVGEALSALVGYNGVYGALNRQMPERFADGVILTLGACSPLVGLYAVGLLSSRPWRKQTPVFRAAALTFPVWLAFVAVQGRLEPHYALVVVPGLSVVGARGLARMSVPARRTRDRIGVGGTSVWA